MICNPVYTDILKYKVAEQGLFYQKAAGCGEPDEKLGFVCSSTIGLDYYR